MPTTKIESALKLANQTWEVLQSSDIPEAEMEVAFGAIFSYLAQDDAGSGSSVPAPEQLAGRLADEPAAGLAGVAQALKIDEETASYLYDIDGRELDLTIARDDLSTDRATAMREVALLVVAGRQASGIDKDRTDSGQVRNQGVHLGVMAKNTFRQEMGALNPHITSKPQGQYGRSLKMTRIGYDAAASIAQRVATRAED